MEDKSYFISHTYTHTFHLHLPEPSCRDCSPKAWINSVCCFPPSNFILIASRSLRPWSLLGWDNTEDGEALPEDTRRVCLEIESPNELDISRVRHVLQTKCEVLHEYRVDIYIYIYIPELRETALSQIFQRFIR